MTTEMLSAFIGTTEATTAKHRITSTMYLPPNLANLDLNSFDSSNLTELVVNMTKVQDTG